MIQWIDGISDVLVSSPYHVLMQNLSLCIKWNWKGHLCIRTSYKTKHCVNKWTLWCKVVFRMFHCHIIWWLLYIGFLKLLFRYSQSMRVGKHYEQRHFVEFRIEHPVLGNCDGVHVTFKLKKYCGTLTVTMYCFTWAELSCPTVFFVGTL